MVERLSVDEKYERSSAIYAIIKDDVGNIDIEVKVIPGGSLRVGLEHWQPCHEGKPTLVNLPNGMPRDQKRWVCDENGMRPLRHDEKW